MAFTNDASIFSESSLPKEQDSRPSKQDHVPKPTPAPSAVTSTPIFLPYSTTHVATSVYKKDQDGSNTSSHEYPETVPNDPQEALDGNADSSVATDGASFKVSLDGSWEVKYKALEELMNRCGKEIEGMREGIKKEMEHRMIRTDEACRALKQDVQAKEEQNIQLKAELKALKDEHSFTLGQWRMDRAEMNRLQEVTTALEEEANTNCIQFTRKYEEATAKLHDTEEENGELKRSIALLKTELSGEVINHRIAAGQATILNEDLDCYKRNYENLQADFTMFKQIYKTLDTQKKDAEKKCSDYQEFSSKLRDIRDELVAMCVKRDTELFNLKESMEAITHEREVLKLRCDTRARHIAGLKDDIGHAALRERNLWIESEKKSLDAITLQTKYDALVVRTLQQNIMLSASEKKRSDLVIRLQQERMQTSAAVEGQIDALDPVEKMKSGEVTLDGKKIGVFDEDEEVVPENNKEDETSATEVDELSGENDDDDDDDEDYVDCSEDEYDSEDDEYEYLSEDDENDTLESDYVPEA